MTEKEKFKDIPNYEGLYQVSNFGRVKSLERRVKSKGGSYRLVSERLLTSNFDCSEYCVVRLSKGNKVKKYLVHQLVAMAFLNHKPKGHKLVVDHIDNNKTNNKLSNLQVITQRENIIRRELKKSSKYTGVSRVKGYNKWVSRIVINGKRKHLGYFNCELAAAAAYNKELNNIL